MCRAGLHGFSDTLLDSSIPDVLSRRGAASIRPMQHRISHGPVFSILEFELAEGEEVVAQPNSMLSMSTGVELTGAVGKTTDKVGWWGGFKSVLGGESFFRAVFRAKRDGQTLILAPDSYGDILTLDLAEVPGYQLTRGSFLASAGPVEMKVVYGGVKGVLAKTGLFLLRVSGEGTVFCQSFGHSCGRTLPRGNNSSSTTAMLSPFRRR